MSEDETKAIVTMIAPKPSEHETILVSELLKQLLLGTLERMHDPVEKAAYALVIGPALVQITPQSINGAGPDVFDDLVPNSLVQAGAISRPEDKEGVNQALAAMDSGEGEATFPCAVISARRALARLRTTSGKEQKQSEHDPIPEIAMAVMDKLDEDSKLAYAIAISSSVKRGIRQAGSDPYNRIASIIHGAYAKLTDTIAKEVFEKKFLVGGGNG